MNDFFVAHEVSVFLNQEHEKIFCLVIRLYQFLLQEIVSSFSSFDQQFFINIPTINQSLC